MSEDQEIEILNEALERPPGQERQLYLDRSCGQGTELRSHIEALLHVQSEAQVFFDKAQKHTPLGGSRTLSRTAEVAEKPGTIVGHYKLLEHIGEGGFGVVYMAEQEKPVRRKVALKIIKAGMDTKQVIARFEAERQALAMMDHPHIAKVLDAGATEQGRPYFVMELVRGVPITKFCEQNQLTVQERLELFAPICQAIQHAHQKGIIHRDIKPTNVLVTLNGALPHPMVIDFGVAKAIDQRLTEKTLFTHYAQMIGTPAYMSPEQAEMSKQDVDTRTDVYSLGILLYELLTGITPFPEERFKKVGYAEIQRIISEEEPVLPSTVLSRLNGRAKTVAANRRCEPAALMKLIRGDLDWIILKSIDKDRNRRYATPLELAADLQRYLRSEPVEARPPTWLYRFRKFSRRNRTAVVASLVIVATIVGGLWLTTWQAIRATRSQADAEREAATAEAALRFIQEDLFRSARFQSNVKLVDAMQAAVKQMGDRYRDQPLVEAAIQLTLGKGFLRLDQELKAQEHLFRSVNIYSEHLGPRHEKTLEAKLELAWVLGGQSRFEEAVSLIEEVIAERLVQWGQDHEETLNAMVCAGHLYVRSAQHEKGERTLLSVVDLAARNATPNYEIIHDAVQGLAWVDSARGGPKVLELRREAFEIASEHFGPDDPRTLHDACFRVQHLGLELKRYEEASLLAQDTYPRLVRVLGADNVKTRWLIMEMAFLDQAKGFHIIPDLRSLLNSIQQEIQMDQWDLLWPQYRLGMALINNGNYEEAVALLRDVWERNTRLEGGETWLSRNAANQLALSYTLNGQLTEAQGVCLEQIAIGLEALGGHTPWVRGQRLLLANLIARQGMWDEALQGFLACAEGTNSNGTALVSGLLTAWLAQDRASLSRLGNQAFLWLSTSRNPAESFALAEGLLLTLNRIPDLNVQKVIQASEHTSTLLAQPVDRAQLSVLTSWRKQDWIKMAEQSRELMADRDAKISSLGGFLLAIAYHHSGDSKGALQSFNNAREQLESLLAAGDLGASWINIAKLLILNAIAANLVESQETASIANPTLLADTRAHWQPVSQLLNQADWTARSGDWDFALQEYQQAMAHPKFSWNAACHQDAMLGHKLAVLLLLTSQTEPYQTLCRERIQSTFPLLLSPEILDRKLLDSALSRARGHLDELLDDEKSAEARHEWELTIGLAEFRRGNLSKTLEFLELAQGAFDLNVSATAAAFAGLASWKLEMTEAARSLLGKAERIHQDLRTRNQEDLGPQWYRSAILEIALREARQALSEEINRQKP